MPRSQQPNPKAPFDLSSSWSCGRRTPRWDALWARLLAHALDQSTQPETKLMATVEEARKPDEVNGRGGDVRASEGPGRPAAD